MVVAEGRFGDQLSGKTEAIRIRKGLTLYKQPLRQGQGSPYWYARVYMPIGSRAIHTKSTGTTDQRQATKQAEDLWGKCLLWRQGGIPLPSPDDTKLNLDRRFDRVADAWLDILVQEAGTDQRRLRNVKDNRHIIYAVNGLAAFFGGDDVDDITTDRIRAYLRFKVEKSRKGTLASATQKRTLVTLNQIMRHAYDRRLISHLPSMPKVKLQQEPRGWFNKTEYRQLYTKAWVLAREARKAGDEQGFDRWMEMADFVVFMVNTFLRPSEWAEIRHRHVTVKHGEPSRYLEIAIIRGKTRKRVVVSMPRAAAVYDRIVARGGDDPEGFLFKSDYSNRQTAMERMRDQFDILLEKTGLKESSLGVSRPLYSLRHTSLMFRALYGDNVDLLALAKNAGTSIAQLEKFYLSHITAGMKLANLHSFKPRK
jgi:hypothetical protein